MFLTFFKEPVRKAFVDFEAFSGGFILFELEIISFLPMIFKLFFRGAGFAHYFAHLLCHRACNRYIISRSRT